MNFTYLVRNVESNVGITVFFEENLDQASINAIGEQIRSRTDLVTECRYVSAPEAWDEFAANILKATRRRERTSGKAWWPIILLPIPLITKFM